MPRGQGCKTQAKPNVRAGNKAYSVEENLYPRKASVSGFLAKGESLADVIKRDAETVKLLKTTHKEIGDRIQELLVLDRNFSRGLSRIDHFSIRSHSPCMGGQHCPFHNSGGICPDNTDNHQFGSYNFEITNENTGEVFGGNGLLPHLIRDHKFFEGNVSHRINPVRATRILELGIFKNKTYNDFSDELFNEIYPREYGQLISGPAAEKYLKRFDKYELGEVKEAGVVVKKHFKKARLLLILDLDAPFGVDYEAIILAHGDPTKEEDILKLEECEAELENIGNLALVGLEKLNNTNLF